MKKSYNKPIITFQSLAVPSVSIASSCLYISTNNAEYVCPIIDEEAGWTLFTDYDNCNEVVDDPSEICYDIPLDGRNIFQS